LNEINQRDQKWVPLGFIAGVYGVKGWVKIHSWTDPKEAILAYQPWLLGEDRKPVKIIDGRPQGKTIVASLPGIENREQAQECVGQEIWVLREQLPETGENEYYWSDLIGLAVETKDGAELGHIVNMLETGAHDVMVVRGDRERIIPFIPDHYVISVDLKSGTLVVDWEPDYLT
jgi:16S rRNA processing protein RimM